MRIAIAGADGRMGKMLIEAVLEHPNFTLNVALSTPDSPNLNTDAAEFLGKKSEVLINPDLEQLKNADCLIDFTRPEGSLKHLEACIKYNVAMVIGTTGFSAAQLETIQAGSKDIPIVLSPNMSIGVNVLYALLEQASSLLDENYDIEIYEAHHRNKVDAPSGTAIRMGEVIAESKNKTLNELADWARHGYTGVREYGKIGFSVARGGDTIGDHTASYCGPGERIEITHKATNRTIYAQGSLKAAQFLKNKQNGFYDMRDVITG